jgi:predicted NBD/HSP70 family sugar kinase
LQVETEAETEFLERRPPNSHYSGALNNAMLRSVNESLVLGLIREWQPIARVDLARSTRLKESTVSSIVKELLDRGLVAEAGLGTSAGGRKPRMLVLDGGDSRVLAIDVAAGQTTIGIADLKGKILYRKVCKTNRDPDRFLKQLIREADAVVRAQVPDESKLEAIGVSSLGLVDMDEGTIIHSSNLGWSDPVPVGAALRERFSQEIAFDRDVLAAGLSELWFGGLDPACVKDLAVIMVNEGVGAAVFSQGRLVRGSNLGGGQFGHVCIRPGGVRCRCGCRGCWEAYAADPGIVGRYLARGSARSAGSEPTVGQIAERALAGEQPAVATIRETARYMGEGIAVIVNAMNPSLIVVTGEITRAWSLMQHDILKNIRKRTLRPNHQSLRIQPSQIRENPCFIGAVSLALSKRFAGPRVGLEVCR